MAKRLEQRLAAVREALDTRDTPPSRKALVDGLRGKHGIVIATIADALEADDEPLLARLPDAFATLRQDPVKRDPGCLGKSAIVRALYRTDALSDEVFLAGIDLRQYEPVFGGRVDTAAQLRGVCGMALAAMRHPQAMRRLAILLADPELAARIAAARAVAASGDRTTGEPLLRLRLAVGERDPEALAEDFAALLELAGDDDETVAYVATHLDDRDEAIAEAAALALGGSRRTTALAALVKRLEGGLIFGARRRVLSLGVALVRSEAAWSWLLRRLAEAEPRAAEDALRALATFSHDEKLVERVRRTLAEREDPTLSRLADELLDDA
jgi:hypothetical protein